jgi:integrase
MRLPSYRKHSSGQARVTINGKDHLLGPYGSPASKEAYGRLIAEFSASGRSHCFGEAPSALKMEDVLLAFIRHARDYYRGSSEFYHYQLAATPIARLYASLPAEKFGPTEFRAIQADWMSDPKRSRSYINKMMSRARKVIKWAVGAGMMPPASLEAIRCVDPLRKGRCSVRETTRVTCVDQKLVDATLPHLTPVVRAMVELQQLLGARPGEICSIRPRMVDRTGDVWRIDLQEHKNAHRDKQRVLFVGPRGQEILSRYLLRHAESYCFSPIESEKQRREARHQARKTKLTTGNRPGTNRARKPRRAPKDHFTTGTYGRSIRNACLRNGIEVWGPNRLRHNRATLVRAQYGLEAASAVLGHSGLAITETYAEMNMAAAAVVAREIG